MECAKCKHEGAPTPCFGPEHAAKALGCSLANPNAALRWFNKHAPAMAETGCMPCVQFRQAIFDTTLQPVWAKKPLSELLLSDELKKRTARRRLAPSLGDADKERLIEEIDRLIAVRVLKTDSGSHYDPRKGAGLRTYMTFPVEKRLGDLLRKIGRVVPVIESKSQGSKAAAGVSRSAPLTIARSVQVTEAKSVVAFGALRRVTPPELCVNADGAAESDLMQRQRSAQLNQVTYKLTEARIYENALAPIVKQEIVRDAKKARSPQHADALYRSSRLIVELADWHPQRAHVLDLQVGSHVLSIPTREFFPQSVASELGYSNGNGTELARLLRKHVIDGIHGSLSGANATEVRDLLKRIQEARELALHILTSNIEGSDWEDFLINAAACAGVREIPADGPARLFHMIRWSEINPHARGYTAPTHQDRRSLGHELSKPETYHD